MRRDLLLVEWWDHSSSSAWQSEHEVRESAVTPLLVRSVGWIVAETRKQIALAARISDDSELGLGNVQMIMKAAIKSRRALRRAR